MMDGFTLYEIIEEVTGLIWNDATKNLEEMTKQLQAAVARGATALRDAQQKHAKELHAAIKKQQKAEQRSSDVAHGPPRRPYDSVAHSTQRDRWRECEQPLAWWRRIAGMFSDGTCSNRLGGSGRASERVRAVGRVRTVSVCGQ